MATSAEEAAEEVTSGVAAEEGPTSAAAWVVAEASQEDRSEVVRASAAVTMANPFVASPSVARTSEVPALRASRAKGGHFVPAQAMPIVVIGTAARIGTVARTGTVAEIGAIATAVVGADIRAIMATDITTITPITAATIADGSMATPFGRAVRIGGGDTKPVRIDRASPV